MEDRVHRTLLHLAAEIHHHDVVGHLGDHAHVVRDQDHRQPAFVLQSAEQIQDLRLGGHIQRRGRLVGDQDARLGGQRERDHHALTQAAGELEANRHPRAAPGAESPTIPSSSIARSRAARFDSRECSRIASINWLPTV